jgi:VWFA-related protein
VRQRIQLFLFLFLLPLLLPFSPLRAQGLQDNDPTLWPESERAFYQDGPGLLLTPEQRTDLRGLTPEARARWIKSFLDKDPIPETPGNELRDAIALRWKLANDQFPSPRDERAQLLFLNGMPVDRLPVDCAAVFKPLEVWSYPSGVGPDGKQLLRSLVVYSPAKGEPYRLWVPSDSKRSLYTPLMEYWLEQWEELRGKIRAVRFDLQNCKEAKKVDEATGVPGLTGALENRGNRVRPKDNSALLQPPSDLARWAREAAATELPPLPSELKVTTAQMQFPEKVGQRVVARALVALPADAGFQATEDSRPLIKLIVEGLIEQQGEPFQDFRMRFQVPPPQRGEPVILAIDQPLRPKANYVMRLKIRDEASGAEAWISRGFRVPLEATPVPMPAAAAKGELVPATAVAGADSLLLLPPADDILLGLWRAEAIVTGEKIQKVTFLVDGKPQLTTSKKPFTAEVRLERYPTEQTVRAEGYDAEGRLVASDEVILNQPRGTLNVRIVSPSKGTKVQGKTKARAEVVVPDGRRIKSMDFRINDQTVASLANPPWEAEVNVPADAELVYLTVLVTLDDGSTTEAVRYLKSPEFVSEVEVNLVELYVAVTDRSGDLVTNLTQADFEVYESEKKQEIVKFELVQNLPLTIGILLDTSGSMAGSMVETQKAASGFLESVMRPKDRAFAVSFARRPRLEMPPTDDVGAVIQSIDGLQAVGDTALHDALVHSLYYFRGIQGQRAMVLLSDGDDNASYINYKDVIEYAKRSGVAIYTIGLNIPAFEVGIRGKLGELAEATGGRTFLTGNPEELPGIYKQIETELRSRYLVAYNSTETGGQPGFRPVEVKLKKGGMKARTARGYYP